MANALQAIDYLAEPEKNPPEPVCVLSGDELFLKRQVLVRVRRQVLGEGGGDGEFSLSTFEGRTAELRDVLDELSTIPMFGSGKRLVTVDEADPFVSAYRSELEEYVANPRRTAILLLEVKSWPQNTRLSKAVAASGLQIDCSAPRPAKLAGWLCNWAAQAHEIRLERSAAGLLVEMAGPELGLLDQELAKLALEVGRGGKVDPEHVSRGVGTWRAKTAWVMLDAALDGKVSEAMVELDRLLLAGENPVAVLGQIAASLRRLAAATRIALRAEQSGRRVQLRAALEQAGVPPFLIGKAQGQLRKLGRHRGDRLYGWLLEADLDMKGASALPPRLILERLIMRLAVPGGPTKATAP